jgi:hypothetical protein
MQLEAIKECCQCCCCRGSLSESVYVNLVEIQKLIWWDYPSSGNVLTGVQGLAVSVLCDGCFEAQRQPLFAIEFAGTEVRYHDLEDLESV